MKRRRVLVLVLSAILACGGYVLFSGYGQYGGTENPWYEIAISEDGRRVAVLKQPGGGPIQVFEAALGSPWAPVAAPQGLQLSPMGVSYAPGKPAILFATVPRTGPAGQALWRQPVPAGEPSVVLEYPGYMANLLPLRSGAIAFFGEVASWEGSWSPNPRTAKRRHAYQWMLWEPGGTVRSLTQGWAPLTGPATLVRDEFVVFVQEHRDRAVATAPPSYSLVSLRLGQGDTPPLDQALIEAPSHGDPRLDCDWSGRTCVRLTTYDKRYYAHKAELLRGGQSCALPGLPDRIERHRVAGDGSALLLLARADPYDAPLVLVHLVLDPSGCGVRSRTDIALP